MTYKLAFKTSAQREWNKLTPALKAQFKQKLRQRLEQPHVASAALRGGRNLYKIKLKALGYRLVYEVSESSITVIVIAVGKREKNKIYRIAIERTKN
tara:strand:+ start:5191 stop:5481 length:291 start_codon:yes stop_codon:yes gene_type:complete